MTRTKFNHIEPGMLTLFRLAYIIWLLLSIAVAVMALLGLDNVTLPKTILGPLSIALLLVYLFSGRLQRWLGAWYLPIGLLAASVGAVTFSVLNTIWLIQSGAPPTQIPDQDVMPQLLILVIIVSVQYGFRGAIIYTIGMAAIQAAIMLPIVSHTQPSAIMESVYNTLPFISPNVDSFDIATWAILGQLIGFPIVAFVVVGLTGGQVKERRALAKKNIELTQYATTIERLAISQERNRLARELHDTLAHTLSAVSVQVEALNKQLERDPESAKDTVQQLRELTRNGMKESRRALRALRASPLEDMGLSLAMQQLVNTMTERSGMDVTLQLDDSPDNLRPEVEQSVYRITEEALNNANRHAQAKKVDVVLKAEGRGLKLTVADDGCGFDPNTVSLDGHYGLTGMRERASLCGGELNFVSQHGTQVILTIEELT